MFNTDTPFNNILKVMDGYRFCLVSNKTHVIRMIELQMSQFHKDPLYEAYLITQITPSPRLEIIQAFLWIHKQIKII